MKFFKIALYCFVAVLFLFTGITNLHAAADVTVKIGAAFDITGPYSDLGMLRAYEDCVKWTNEQGGFKDVKGQTCKIKLIWQDCASDIPKGMAAYKDFKAQGCVVQYYSSTGQNYALKKKAQKDKVPLVSQLVSNIIFEGKDSWIYSMAGQREASIQALDGIKSALPKIYKKDKPPRIGFLCWNNIIGEDFVPYAKAYAKLLGFEVGIEQYFSPKALDVTPQIRKLADDKCDFVILSMAGGQEAIIVKNKYDAGLKEPFRFVSFGPSITAGWATIKNMDPKYHNGNLIQSTFATQDDDSEGSRLMIKLQKKYHKGEVMWDLFEDYAWGFHSAYVTVKAIELALKTVPGDKLTGADVKKYGLDKFDINTFGLSMGASFANYPGDKNATIGGRLFEQRDRKLIPLTDWIGNNYQAPYSPLAPEWVKKANSEMMEFYKAKKKKKRR